MKIIIMGRHEGVSGAVKDYAGRKAEKLQRFSDLVQSVDVTLTVEGDVHEAELVATAKRGVVLVATEKTHNMYEAIDLAFDKLERQLSKRKDKMKARRVKRPAVVEHVVSEEEAEE